MACANGVPTVAGPIDPVTLPDLVPFSAGEMDVEVAEGATLALDPGAYAEVEVKRSATLQLRAGEYFMDRLETLLGSKIEINGKVAVLKKRGKQLRLTRNDDHGGDWVVLSATPPSAIENQNKGVRILAFTAPAAPQLKLSVSMQRP